MPTPKKNEEKKDFIDRCMRDDMMHKYDGIRQRLAICHSFWDEGIKESMTFKQFLMTEARRTDDDGDYAYDNWKDKQMDNTPDRTADDWAKLVVKKAQQSKDLKKAVNIGSTQIELLMREISKSIGVPAEMIKATASIAADKVPV